MKNVNVLLAIWLPFLYLMVQQSFTITLNVNILEDRNIFATVHLISDEAGSTFPSIFLLLKSCNHNCSFLNPSQPIRS